MCSAVTRRELGFLKPRVELLTQVIFLLYSKPSHGSNLTHNKRPSPYKGSKTCRPATTCLANMSLTTSSGTVARHSSPVAKLASSLFPAWVNFTHVHSFFRDLCSSLHRDGSSFRSQQGWLTHFLQLSVQQHLISGPFPDHHPHLK